MLRETVAYLQAQGECQGPPASVPSSFSGTPAPSRSGRAGLKGPTYASSCTDPDWSPRTESGWGSLHMSPELRDSSGPTVS